MPQTDAHRRATRKFESKTYDKILVRIRRDADLSRDTINEAASAAGLSLNAFIKDAIVEKMNNVTKSGKILIQLEDLERYEKEARDRDMDLQEMILLALQEFIKNN